jgi:preprotein translocase subunit SecG
MQALILAIHILICLALILVILLQSGKGGGLAGGAFGGTAQTVFGGRGATDFLTRATMVLGGAFFLTSLTLALMSSGTRGPSRSLIQEEAQRAVPTAPQQGGQGVPQAPAGQAPAGQAPAGQAPAGQAPAGQAPSTQPAPAASPAGGGR